MYRTTMETALNLCEGIVGSEKSRNTRPVRIDGVIVLVLRYVSCQLEQVDFKEKRKDGVGRQIIQEMSLSPANITGTRRTRCHTTGERADFIAKVIATNDTAR